MEKQKKTSFAKAFTAFSSFMILFITISLSAIFFYNLRSITSNLAEINTKSNVAHSRDMILSEIEKHEEALKFTAIGIVHFFEHGIASIEALASFMEDVVENLPNSLCIYFTNNLKWFEPGGFASFSDWWVPGDTWDNTQRPWFIEAKNAGGRMAFSEPYVDATSNEIVVTLSMTVFNKEGQDIGVVADDVEVYHLKNMLNEMRNFPEQEIFIINENGLFITHNDINAVMEKDFFSEFQLEQYRNNVLSSADFFNIDKNVFIYSSPISYTSWTLVSTIPASIIFAETNIFILRLIIISFVILAIVIIISILFTNRMLTVPIKGILKITDALAKMDFTVEIKKFRTDEIGDIQYALIDIRDSLKESIDSLHEHLAKSKEESARLNTMIIDSLGSLEAITSSINIMDTKVQSQMKSVQHATDSAAEISHNADEFEKTVHTQVTHISESSTAIEKLAAHINTIRSVVENTNKTTETLSISSESGQKMLIRLTEELRQITEQSETLQKANNAIADITAQTNILAMNAAIEAAHAGEAGKGFAVVSGEVRKLAELSGKESDAISAQIKKMEQTIIQIDKVSKETVSAMNIIFNEIKTLGISFSSVNQAIEEQSAGSIKTISVLQNVHKMTSQVRSGAEVMNKRSTAIRDDMEKLREISTDVTDRVAAMRTASENIALFLDNVRKLKQN